MKFNLSIFLVAMESMNSLFIKQDRLDEAEPLCRRSVELLENLYGKAAHAPALARALMVMAELRHWQVRGEGVGGQR
jgi:hypothetical protein